MNTISFGASHLLNVEVLKKTEKENYEPVDLALVELDKNDEADVEALRKTYHLWDKQAKNYASEIYNEAVKGFMFEDVEKECYYAITEQKSDFDKLDYSRIVGLAMFSKTYNYHDEITWLQVRPDTNYSNSHDRKYIGIGYALVHNFKSDGPLYVNSADDAVEFYKKLGFKNYALGKPTCMRLEG